jgi:translation initiation factor IF-2
MRTGRHPVNPCLRNPDSQGQLGQPGLPRAGPGAAQGSRSGSRAHSQRRHPLRPERSASQGADPGARSHCCRRPEASRSSSSSSSSTKGSPTLASLACDGRGQRPGRAGSAAGAGSAAAAGRAGACGCSWCPWAMSTGRSTGPGPAKPRPGAPLSPPSCGGCPARCRRRWRRGGAPPARLGTRSGGGRAAHACPACAGGAAAGGRGWRGQGQRPASMGAAPGATAECKCSQRRAMHACQGRGPVAPASAAPAARW